MHMQLRIAKTNIRITFFFAVGMTVFSFVQHTAAVLSVLSAALLHELTHLVCLHFCGVHPEYITIGLFGMRMSDECVRLLHYKKELLCTLSAPLCNLLCFALLLPLCNAYEVCQTACAMHFSLGFFNLLPLRCLDGGRSLYCLLSLFCTQEKAEKYMNITEWVFYFLFLCILACVSIFIKPNPSAVLFFIYISFLFLFRK